MTDASPPQGSLIIRTGARLHFGLLDVRPPFGGLGVMVDAPVTEVCFSPSQRFVVSDAVASRANAIADHIHCGQARPETLKVSIDATQRAPSHCGFGSGTQLSLAIAEGLCRLAGRRYSETRLAREIADRGKRSAVGVHGYFHGGLIYETGDHIIDGLNQVQERIALSPNWRIVLLRPKASTDSVYGPQEQQRFESLSSPTSEQLDRLRRIACEQILPAARYADFDAFSTAVTQYNHHSGMLFARSQGGPYNGPWVTAAVERLSELGVRGIGQSSWGPGVFAWCENIDQAQRLAAELEHDDTIIQITSVRNQARTVEDNTNQSAN